MGKNLTNETALYICVERFAGTAARKLVGGKFVEESGRDDGRRHISRKVLNSCLTPAYGLETMAMTEQQERLRVCENNWVRRIAGVKRIDKRRMEELREEV